MIRSLFYKEWIKSRWVILIILIGLAGAIIYTYMGVSRSIRVAGADHIWAMAVQKELTFGDYIKYITLVSGMLLALAQYVPEMINKRLKLTLHLPLPDSRIFFSMLLFGVISLFIIYIFAYFALQLSLNHYFCREITNWSLIRTIPWFLGGIMAYAITTWICIEPIWRQRMLNSVVGLLTLMLFYFDDRPEAYNPFLPFLIIIVFAGFTFPFYSLIRFKEGAQN